MRRSILPAGGLALAAVLWLGALRFGGSVAAPAVGDDGDVARLLRSLAGRRGVMTAAVWQHAELLAAEGPIDRPRNIMSASKSVLSALVGIAIEEGMLPSLDSTVGELLPETAGALPAAKRRIALRDLLSMRSGLATTSFEHYGAWVAQGDWVAAALARPLVAEPGATFSYSTGNAHIVAAALSRAVGRDLLDWGREVLFDPLEIEVHGWDTAPEGVRFGGNNFRITARDLGTFGRLYAAGGAWRGEQLVPAAWVRESTRPHATGWPERYGSYGYLWWIPPRAPAGAFAAVGFGGQFCYVVPASGIVVVVTSTHESKGEAWDRELLAFLAERLLPRIR